jgi:hypothetical protein
MMTEVAAADGSAAIAVFAVVQRGDAKGMTDPPMFAGAATPVQITLPAVPSRMSTVTFVAEVFVTVMSVAQ